MKKSLLMLSLLAMNAYADCGAACDAAEAAAAAAKAASQATINTDDTECLLSDVVCYRFEDEETGKTGIKNKDGKIILPAKYDSIYDADVSETGNGYLKTVLYSHSPRYDAIYGILDKTGKELIEPRYESIQAAKHGFIVRKDDFYGFLDLTGKEIVPLIYRDWEADDSGNMIAYLNQYILLNSKGKVITQSPALVSVDDDNAIFAQHTKDGIRFGVIDKTGKVIVPAIYHGLLPLKDIHDDQIHPILGAFNGDGKVGLIDIKTGKLLTDFRYDGITEQLSEGMVVVKVGERYGFVDIATGKEVIKPIYDEVGLFRAGLVLVAKDGEWFYINKTGKQVR